MTKPIAPRVAGRIGRNITLHEALIKAYTYYADECLIAGDKEMQKWAINMIKQSSAYIEGMKEFNEIESKIYLGSRT